MQDYLSQVYKHKHLATANAEVMKQIIYETALDW